MFKPDLKEKTVVKALPLTKILKKLESPGKLQTTDSDSDFFKTQRLNKKVPLLQSTNQDKMKTARGESESRERDNDRQSSGKGTQSNNSNAGNSYNYPLFNQAQNLTDRSSQKELNSKSLVK
jgi:hypothetical protein